MLLLWFLVLVTIGVCAGIIGSIIGLGGGIVIIPALTLLLGVPISYAAGASLISTIATSSGAASAYVKDRISNMKIGMSLEIGTTMGAIVGSVIAAFIYKSGLDALVFIIFGIVLIVSIYPTIKRSGRDVPKRIRPDLTTRIFQMKGSYYDLAMKKKISYTGIRWWLGEIVMFFAGIISGLLGIGSGVLKVLAMDSGMNLPAKVSTSTSNFMIGVTAVTGTVIYWELGYIQPFLAGSTAVGVVVGAFIGSKIFNKLENKKIEMILLVAIVVLAIEMILRGVSLWNLKI